MAELTGDDAESAKEIVLQRISEIAEPDYEEHRPNFSRGGNASGEEFGDEEVEESFLQPNSIILGLKFVLTKSRRGGFQCVGKTHWARWLVQLCQPIGKGNEGGAADDTWRRVPNFQMP